MKAGFIINMRKATTTTINKKIKIYTNAELTKKKNHFTADSTSILSHFFYYDA